MLRRNIYIYASSRVGSKATYNKMASRNIGKDLNTIHEIISI
jgi:hypothetical protein